MRNWYCIELFISMNHDGFELPISHLGERQMKITGAKIRNTYYCERNVEWGASLMNHLPLSIHTHMMELQEFLHASPVLQ